jgi:SAM-dependent methyltransferase
MSVQRDPTQATSFGAVADVYERGRPPYPRQAIDWLLPGGARRVADLGAGTGKLTRLLRGRGIDVLAVEPSAGMRQQFRGSVPGVPVAGGAAERMPLADGSIDAVLSAQAWHWVDPGRAIPEMARVLRPGGRLGLLWNTRDERVDWVARLSQIMHDVESHQTAGHTPEIGPPFLPLERLSVEWEFRLPAASLLDYVASRSYVITMAAPDRAATLAAVRGLLATHPDLVGRSELVFPQVTYCTRADLPA